MRHTDYESTGLERQLQALTFQGRVLSPGVPLGIYTIAQDLNVALQVQAQILTTLSLVTYAQCKYYQEKWSIRRCIAVIGGAGVCLAGIEVGIILAVRVS